MKENVRLPQSGVLALKMVPILVFPPVHVVGFLRFV
jgi:hypothetical protein